jgi:hypothetical protein
MACQGAGRRGGSPCAGYGGVPQLIPNREQRSDALRLGVAPVCKVSGTSGVLGKKEDRLSNGLQRR